MKVHSRSLRSRLMVLILTPLIAISLLAGYLRFTAAEETSEEIFDRMLTALTLAIAREVFATGGDTPTPAVRDLLKDVSGSELFYHVNGPDGVFLTGYAYPPAAPPDLRHVEGRPVLFEATYREQSVRVARLRENVSIDGITGFATVTVWQQNTAREALVRQLALRSALLMGTLILTVGAVVWFGINLGLKPLTDLRDAIAIRSPDDLSTIKRKVPKEVAGIVATLNALFVQVSRAMASKDVFISDAAHQLRNPSAGIHSMALAVRDAPSEEARKERAAELVEAARDANRLTQQLLSFERARGLLNPGNLEKTDIGQLVMDVCGRNVPKYSAKGVELTFAADGEAVLIIDPLLITEAVQNLLDNALMHAGTANKQINVSVDTGPECTHIKVRDHGRGIPEDLLPHVFKRFQQGEGATGCGLGLAIAKTVAEQHGGTITARNAHPGAEFEIVLKS